MAHYSHILLAVDLSNEAGQVAERGQRLSELYDATLSIVHVIEPVSYTYGGDIPLDFSGIQDEIQQQVQLRRLVLQQGPVRDEEVPSPLVRGEGGRQAG